MDVHAAAQYRLQQDHLRSFILLRWLLLFVAAYLAWFSYAQPPSFVVLNTFIFGFAASNLLCMLVSRERIESTAFQRFIALTDVTFVAVMFYMLRDPGTYFYLSFSLAFAVAALWRDIKVAALSLIGLTLFYAALAMRGGRPSGLRSSLRVAADRLGGEIEPVLTMSLFFVVAIFYLFLSDRFRFDAQVSMVLLEEKRRSDVMVEITRSLSSSLNSREVLHLIVRKISEVFDAAECTIVRPAEEGPTGRVLASASRADVGDAEVDFETIPELRESLASRALLFVPRARGEAAPHSVIVIPLLVQNSVLGLIHIRLRAIRRLLDDADTRFIEVMASSAANALRNAQLFEEMEHRARTDFMTGLANHRFFQESLSAELVRAQRHSHPVSLLLIDLDYLKQINDKFGHPAGDAAIRGIAQTIRSSCRDFDVGARYGGEEFAVILPETQLPGAILVAERIRERIRFVEIPGVGRITASIGVSNFPVNALTKEDLIQAADLALYQAKADGRDRVAHFDHRLRDRA